MSLNRKLEREQLKRAYKQFCREWTQTRGKQLREVEEKNERRVDGKNVLGQAPTFKMYVDAVRDAQAKAREDLKKKLMEQAAKDAEIDTSWEEEAPAGQETSEGGQT